MPFSTLSRYAKTVSAGVETVGVATNASWTGDWINIEGVEAISVQVVLTGTGSPQGSWGVDISNDVKPPDTANPGDLGATAITMPASVTGSNPAGTTADINVCFVFSPGIAPVPRAKWWRFKYTRSGGGSASQLLRVGVNTYGPAA